MAQQQTAYTSTDGSSTSSEGLSSPPAADLSAAIHMLTQAAQSLQTAATQMVLMMQNQPGSAGAGGGGSHLSPAQINIWEDDPFSEAIPTTNPALATPMPVDTPVNNNPLLQTQILSPRPAPSRFPPGTPNFRYWIAAEALARGINFWAPLLPAGTRWSVPNPMHVTLVAGQDLNAFFSRDDGGLFFFHQVVKNKEVFSGESPDVVCHELGHAILDALKPQLFDAASTEVAAFHESFGDMSGILSALQLPTERQKVLTETQGKLNVTSRLSRLAEQLGWAIRQLSPTAVDPDCLRNAANRFFYRSPSQLPPQAPARQLSSEVHSFSRVFTGAFLDALAGMLKVLGQANDANLLAVSRAMGQLLVDGIRTAPITPAYFSQVAAGMMQADQARNHGRYRTALSNGFVQHGILSLSAVAALASAPAPQLMAVSAAPEDAPELPISTISTDFGMTLLVHAPAESERFSVTPAVLRGAFAETPSSDEAACAFVEDLIQLGRIDLRSAQGHVPVGLSAPSEDSSRKTHVVLQTPEGLLLKRLHFDCGFHSCY